MERNKREHKHYTEMTTNTVGRFERTMVPLVEGDNGTTHPAGNGMTEADRYLWAVERAASALIASGIDANQCEPMSHVDHVELPTDGAASTLWHAPMAVGALYGADLESVFDATVPARDASGARQVRRSYVVIKRTPTGRVPVLDVVDRWTRRLTVAPDRTAYRGVVRYKAPAPVRYGAAASSVWLAGSVSMLTDLDLAADMLVVGGSFGHTLVTLGETTVVGRGIVLAGVPAWHGHVTHKVVRTQTRAHRAKSAANRRKVATGSPVTGKRGKPVNAWSASVRSLPRIWSRATSEQVATAAALELILRTQSADQVADVGSGHRVTVDHAGACAHQDDPLGRTYPIREYARRAALAGVTLD